MKKTVVIDIVGLSSSVIGEHTPFLKAYSERNHLRAVKPMLPAVTTAVQSTYLTGKWPSDHGIVGNGWYDRIDNEQKFWKQSNELVQAENIWDRAKREDPTFTVSQMFWWYNMYSTADYTCTPRPNYLADGRKIPDCYAKPASLRDELQEKLGQFPLFKFWGAGANIESTQWIAEASKITDDKYDPTLTLIYLPHLDYCQQKHGPDPTKIAKELKEIDEVVKDLVEFYERKNANIVLLSEYGIAPTANPIHLNRKFRREGLLEIRLERGLELLDMGESKAFVIADHQIAHIYIKDKSVTEKVKNILENTPGIRLILDKEAQKEYHIDHERSGDFVVMSDAEHWFTYYFWLDDAVAPDYARCVDIHKKPGYDPVEIFMTSKLRAGYKLLRKKLGFRYVLDIVPLDATLIKGSHGSTATEEKYHPILITSQPQDKDEIEAVDIYEIIWDELKRQNP